MIYVGKNGKAASVSAAKVGDGNGKALNVVGGWVGDVNGKARRIWSLDRPMWKFTCQNGVNLHVSGSGLAIDYGDGASESIGTQTSEYHISHVYADTEPHQVTLYGVLSYVRFGVTDDGEPAKNYLLSVDTPFPKNRIASFDSAFRSCASLTAIPAGLFDNCTAVTEFSYTFSGCASLTAIPAGLFDNCTAVTEFISTFQYCASLLSIPTGLFDNCPNVTSFDSAFLNCASLTAIPAGLFDNCTAVTEFSYTFGNCTAITSAVPELWDTVKWPNVSGYTQCFYNCTNAANYADIPEGWK
jgi:hypothetical protein